MKVYLKILILFLFISTPIFSADLPHLILYFDINKTLIASDRVTNKSIDNVLNELLAEKYEAVWDENQESPISFENYAIKMTDSRDTKLAFVHNFIGFLKDCQHPLLFPVLNDYDCAVAALDSCEGMVFSSFYSLLNFLDREKISYSIVLRSFGEEVIEVKDEIEEIHHLVFADTGKFQQSSLVLESGEVIDEATNIYQLLKKSNHMAIRDDWAYWNAHHMASAQGKPLYVNKGDDEILPIFFDDNIDLTNSSRNIIAPLNALTGELISIEELVESGQAVRVNTWEAIVNPNYFIHLVEAALEKNACLI